VQSAGGEESQSSVLDTSIFLGTVRRNQTKITNASVGIHTVGVTHTEVFIKSDCASQCECISDTMVKIDL